MPLIRAEDPRPAFGSHGCGYSSVARSNAAPNVRLMFVFFSGKLGYLDSVAVSILATAILGPRRPRLPLICSRAPGDQRRVHAVTSCPLRLMS
jgi:hypothetical protein